MKTSDLSIKELAAFIGVSTDTIRRTVRKGEIPATRVGTAYRFDLHQVQHQMERMPSSVCRGDQRARPPAVWPAARTATAPDW